MTEHISRPPQRHAPSFSFSNKVLRLVWGMAWLVCARWTPPQLHAWRVLVLRAFGARIGAGVRIYGSTRVWLPRNLIIGDGTLIGPRVNLYNQGQITIGRDVVISQDSSLCASTHNALDPAFPLILRPITIEDHVWIAAEAFVGPGVTVREGAVLGARAVAMREVAGWTFHSGNPAAALKPRPPFAATPDAG